MSGPGECYLKEDDPAETHPVEDGVVCARCYGALADENVRLSERDEEEGWAWVDEFLKLGGWKNVFEAQNSLRERVGLDAVGDACATRWRDRPLSRRVGGREMLNALIETYLREVGFTTYIRDGVEYWGHPELGHGRTFADALQWWIGREEANRKTGVDV